VRIPGVGKVVGWSGPATLLARNWSSLSGSAMPSVPALSARVDPDPSAGFRELIKLPPAPPRTALVGYGPWISRSVSRSVAQPRQIGRAAGRDRALEARHDGGVQRPASTEGVG